uniref:Jacalin-type lectin domain-containing protein n=1 Tax=Equus asinus asinus TaxID=83772 RepID=A0A8C4L9N6_EQUAS
MLLWLTLALLWSTTCWAERKSGWASPLQPIHLVATLPSLHPGDPGSGPCPGQTNSSLRTPGCHHVVYFLSLTCFFHHLEIHGDGGGQKFSTSPDNYDDITGIRVSTGGWGVIKSIQLRYGSSWRERFGPKGGKMEEFLLQPGEQILMVTGWHTLYLRKLVIYTNRGRMASFGKEEGKKFLEVCSWEWKVLTGIFGTYKRYGITGIGFRWGYPRVDLTTVQNNTHWYPEK